MVHYSESIFDEQAAQATEIGEWLEDHHAVVQSDNGEEYHIFAVTGSPSFGGLGPPRTKYPVNIQIPVGPVIFIIVGSIDLRTLDINANVFLKYALLQPTFVGYLAGSLRKGAQTTFKKPNVSGTIGVVLRGHWLYIYFSVVAFNTPYVGDLRALLLPLVTDLEGAEEKEAGTVQSGVAVAAAA